MNRDEWVDTYQNPKTKHQALTALKAFDKWLDVVSFKEQQVFEILKNNEQSKYETIQKIISYWKSKNIAGSSIKNYWNFLKNWWWHNGIRIYKEDLKAYVKFPRVEKELREPLSIETIRLIVNASKQPYKTLWLVLASSGMRITEALSFGPKEIVYGTPTKIILNPTITKFSTGREIYISSEASEMLKENFDEYNALTPAIAETYFYNIRKKLKLTEKYSNGKNYKVQVHAFKSFFMSAAATIHGEMYAHAMGGHGNYLPQYIRIPKLKREQMYLQVEPNVTIGQKEIETIIE